MRAERATDVMGAYFPAVRTHFTRTLHGPGRAQPRGGPTVAMHALHARNVDAYDALDDVLYEAGDHVGMPWAEAYQDNGAAADSGASNR